MVHLRVSRYTVQQMLWVSANPYVFTTLKYFKVRGHNTKGKAQANACTKGLVWRLSKDLQKLANLVYAAKAAGNSNRAGVFQHKEHH